MNCTCGCSSFHHLRYGRYCDCSKCGKCKRFTFKSDCGFAIDEMFTVLDVLDEDRFWRADRYIRPRDKWDEHVPPMLIIDHEYRGADCYELTDRVVLELRSQCLVRGKPEWGYTDNSQLRISESGRGVLMQQLERIGLPIGRWNDRPYASQWLKEMR